MKQKQVLEVVYNGKSVKVKNSWFMNILRKIFHTNRKHKDRLFIHLFSDKRSLLDLYKHQSTFNPNMPLRGFLYFSGLIQAYLAIQEDSN